MFAGTYPLFSSFTGDPDVHRHHHSPVEKVAVPDTVFTHIHVDLVGPLLLLWGLTCLLTCINWTNRWPEAIPLSPTAVDVCARAFLLEWVAWFGVPHDFSFDRGPQYMSALWASLLSSVGMSCHQATA